jgi:DNA adenine methylase
MDELVKIDKDCSVREMSPEALEKANYLGNKQRLAKYIVGKFPEDVKTIYDPMAGVSSVLIEAAKRGIRVRGNDLSIIPFWYSKGVFEGSPLSESDVEKLVQAPLHNGWLTEEWKGMYPRPRDVRRYLDGLAKKARAIQGAKGWTAKAIASLTLQRLYSESGSGYSTIKYETVDAVRRVVERAAKDINALVAEVSGKGTITNEDSRTMKFPSADVVYFDPPYFKRDKGAVQYFQTYRITNSILLGKEWKAKNLKPEDIPAILEKLCKSCKHIFISTSSNEVMPYAKELSRHKKSMKRFRLSYRVTSGFGSRDEEQHQHLYAAKAEKQSDPFLRVPEEDDVYRYVVHEHWRGKSLHADFRIESVAKKNLIGWTLNTLIADAVKEPVETLEAAKSLKFSDYSKIDWDTGEFAGAQVLSEQKPKPASLDWLEFEGIIEPGETGALEDSPGVIRIVDKGECEYGAQKRGFHEYFPRSARKSGGLSYRVVFVEFKDGAWLLSKPEDQTPYVLSGRAVKDGWVPPQGFSALPKAVHEQVPPEYRYWQMERESERRKLRDALVDTLAKNGCFQPDDIQPLDFEKRKLIPFNQWGGSAKYAKLLAERFPEHKRYVEPFCGSAALFYAKDKAAEAILADLDPDVVFAHKFIQGLTRQAFESLKRFNWTVSRSGFQKVRECKPKSDTERFWKMVYTRLCAWGGKPDASGYSTINEGKTYGLEDLWRFHEKLTGAKILVQDWQKTLAEYDGPGSLFFIDPPYVDEWGSKEEISPEDIAKAASNLKGNFVIAYTDSARARKAFAKTGKQFKMKFMEARHAGLWQKRSRLFVASFDVRKGK